MLDPNKAVEQMQSEFSAGFQAGAASRDAEVAELVAALEAVIPEVAGGNAGLIAYNKCKSSTRQSEEAMSKIIPGEPSAWEVHVRSIHPEVTDWRRYNIYETLERAQETVKRVEGPPLELKIVPLYAVKEKP